MSVEFNWERILENSNEIEQGICDFLHAQFQALNLPPFISSLSVSSFKLGNVPPEVVIKHFSDPFPEFYEADKEIDELECDESKNSDDSSSTAPAAFGRHSTPDFDYRKYTESSEANPLASPFDVQSFIEFKYSGDMQLSVMATLLVNYPAPSFISLPFSIKVTNVEIDSLIVAAVIENRVHVSILCDLDDEEAIQSEPASVIKSMKIDSEIGDNSNDGAVLRNVSKVEKFVLEQLRNVIRDELVWPGWITLEL